MSQLKKTGSAIRMMEYPESSITIDQVGEGDEYIPLA